MGWHGLRRLSRLRWFVPGFVAAVLHSCRQGGYQRILCVYFVRPITTGWQFEYFRANVETLRLLILIEGLSFGVPTAIYSMPLLRLIQFYLPVNRQNRYYIWFPIASIHDANIKQVFEVGIAGVPHTGRGILSFARCHCPYQATTRSRVQSS